MKILFILEVVAALTFSEAVSFGNVKDDKQIDIKELDVKILLLEIHQLSTSIEQSKVCNTYDIEANIGKYKYPQMVRQFMVYYKKGMLPRGELFSMYYKKHREQAIILYNLFYFANDYNTFYKTACWASDRVNEEMFKYSFSIAVMHRDDTKGVMLPSPYDVDPNLFVDGDVDKESEKNWMKDARSTNHRSKVVGTKLYRNREEILSYFTRNLNLNAFNTYYNYYYPSWYNTTLYGDIDHNPEQWYNTYKKIYASYNLQRLSNDLPDVLPINITNYIEENAKPYASKQDVHSKEYVADMIQSNTESPNYNIYSSAYRMYNSIIEDIVDEDHKNGLTSSALEHPETVLTDHVFYRVWKSIDQFIQNYTNLLPPYTHNDLAFEGVKVENMDVSRLYTYFDAFGRFQLSSLPLNEVKGLYDLTYYPFSYNIKVSSDKAQDVYVRVFLGPKFDYKYHEYDLNVRRHYFVKLDHFKYHVDVGKTMIKRVHPTGIELDERKKLLQIVNAINTGSYLEGMHIFENRTRNYCAYEEELMIPKGKEDGQAYTFYVIVTPYLQQESDLESNVFCIDYVLDKPLGFPFDRKIYSNDFYSPNMYFKDVFIFFEEKIWI